MTLAEKQLWFPWTQTHKNVINIYYNASTTARPKSQSDRNDNNTRQTIYGSEKIEEIKRAEWGEITECERR